MSQAVGEILSYRSRRGTRREYEMVLILRPETSKATIAALIGRIQEILSLQQARLQKIDNWGLRTLAFPIRRCKRGIYIYLRFLAGSGCVAELERQMRIREDVIRYLSVRVEDDVDPNARPSEVTDEILDAASEPAPDPLELAAQQQQEEAAAAGALDDDDDDQEQSDDEEEEDE